MTARDKELREFDCAREGHEAQSHQPPALGVPDAKSQTKKDMGEEMLRVVAQPRNRPVGRRAQRKEDNHAEQQPARNPCGLPHGD